MVVDTDFPPGQSVPVRPTPEGFMTIPVLEFLEGEPWTDVTMGYITALRPSYIRHASDDMTTDAVPWRVTVHFDDDQRISEIKQEVLVCLPEGMAKGNELKMALRVQKRGGPLHGIYSQLTVSSPSAYAPREGRRSPRT